MVEISEKLIHQRIQARYSVAQAALVRRLGNLDQAEDAMQEAVVKALESWPRLGIPDNIVAWLVTAGMNAFRDGYRRESRGRELILEMAVTERDHKEVADDLEDDVLRLIFMCCHPAIAVENQLALTLKMVMGFSQTEIASALLVQERTLEQRITRSKRKIAATGIDFQLPDSSRLDVRLQPVQQVLYLIFNEGYYGSSGTLLDQALCRNAIILCRSLCRLYPQPENLGLLALMLFQDARAPARLDEAGKLVTLDQQDRSLWRQVQIREADVLLQKALRHGQADRYQLQAAIAGLHSLARRSEDTDWTEIVGLYKLLLQKQPDPIVYLNYSVALMFDGQVKVSAPLLHELEPELGQYSPYWAARAKLAELQGDQENRAAALQTALKLSGSEEEMRHYELQLGAINKPRGIPGHRIH